MKSARALCIPCSSAWNAGVGCSGGKAPIPGGVRAKYDGPAGTAIRIEMVYVSDRRLAPFWISKREVTWGEFNRFYEFREEEKADGVTRPSVGREYVAASGLPAEFMEAARPVTAFAGR